MQSGLKARETADQAPASPSAVRVSDESLGDLQKVAADDMERQMADLLQARARKRAKMDNSGSTAKRYVPLYLSKP